MPDLREFWPSVSTLRRRRCTAQSSMAAPQLAPSPQPRHTPRPNPTNNTAQPFCWVTNPLVPLTRSTHAPAPVPAEPGPDAPVPHCHAIPALRLSSFGPDFTLAMSTALNTREKRQETSTVLVRHLRQSIVETRFPSQQLYPQTGKATTPQPPHTTSDGHSNPLGQAAARTRRSHRAHDPVSRAAHKHAAIQPTAQKKLFMVYIGYNNPQHSQDPTDGVAVA
ncbi:hypothetical protein IQ07DRAFT_599887 [Pyrenochaeta sp. DS3sAY3a]|nr:hypothetical protein IQ07DRAFT_599887 [Pyrenochaeta sp. DS3sAY3a]